MRQSGLFRDMIQGTGIGDQEERKGGNAILKVCYCINLLRSLLKGSQKAPSKELLRTVYRAGKEEGLSLSAFPIFGDCPTLCLFPQGS